MKRLAVLGLVILAMLAVTAVSTVVQRDLSHTNDFILLGALEPFVVLLGGIVASVYLARRRDNARGVFGVGLYSLIILSAAATILTILDLLVRGPGDWASGSDTVKLYSFPLIVLGIAISLAILQVTAPGRSLPRGRPGNTSA